MLFLKLSAGMRWPALAKLITATTMSLPNISSEQVVFWVTILTSWAAIVSLAYTVLAFHLKSGIHIRGTFSLVSSSISCQDGYIKNITIENLKDKAAVIYGIYLRLASNCYLILETFEAGPLILKPFEVFTKEYDPVDFYSMSMKTLDLRQMLKTERMNKIKIVLSTGEGLYHVKQSIRIKRAYELFFRNYLTAIALPIKSVHKGRAYGGNAMYLIDLVNSNGEEACIPIYPQDHTVQRFRDFPLTQESLASRDSLEKYLRIKMEEGRLRCASLNVIDMKARRDNLYKDYGRDPIPVKPMSKIAHESIGLAYTFTSNAKNSWRNRRALDKNSNQAPVRGKLWSAIQHLWRSRQK
jgi:hypothetical protein